MNEGYYVYGTGNTSKVVTDYLLGRQIEILGYVDSNSEKWGKNFESRKIIAPEEMMKNLSENVKVIIASIYYTEIKESLLEMGIKSESILIAPFGITIEF